ncbi:hypothetical protein [Lewinella sp. JB7]|nr:hypothetical protein [Lewinella sp. JB7]MCP9236246.1 hypothetical protein [Lewinella sp. JB7]
MRVAGWENGAELRLIDQLDLAEHALPDGVYTVSISDSHQQMSTRLVVKR